VFNPVCHDGKLYLHLNRRDDQVKTLRRTRCAKLVFQDILAVIPSHWVDQRYGGAATTYYRYAEIDCEATLVEAPEDMRAFLEAMMARFQPEGRFDPLDPASPVYADSYEMILVVVFAPGKTVAKWKLGQNRSLAERETVMARLRERRQGHDLRTADEMRKWIDRNRS
jgi:predicted FMN-binding regulatory protein PaiB